MEEILAKADEQHLDADVEVGRGHKTWRIEDVVGDAADAAPERMNSFVQSKTEVTAIVPRLAAVPVPDVALVVLAFHFHVHRISFLCWFLIVSTTPQMTRFRGAKVCSKWLQEIIDDHNIQSDYKCTTGLKVLK